MRSLIHANGNAPLTLPINPRSSPDSYNGVGINGHSAVNAGVIDQPENLERRRVKPSAAKTWLKAIELTSRIETAPRRLFADIVEDWSERQPDRLGLISEA